MDAHRLPLGMPYPKQAKKIVEAAKDVEALLIDATGVGRAMIDLVRADGIEAWAVTIISGKTVFDRSHRLRNPHPEAGAHWPALGNARQGEADV